MSQVILGLVLAAGVFAYISNNVEIESQENFKPRKAVIYFSNQFMAYVTLLTLFFVMVQKMNFSVLPASVVAAQANIYIVLMLIIFIFEFWSLLTKLKKDNIEVR